MWKLSSVHFRSPRSITNSKKINKKTGKKKHLKVKYPFRDHSFMCPWGAAVTGWRRRSTLSVLSLLSVSTWHSKNVDKFRQLECSAVAVRLSFLFLPLSVCFGALVSHIPRLGNYTHPQEHTQTHTHTSADVNKLCTQEPADHRCSGSPASRT